MRRSPVLLLVLTFLAMAKFYAHELVLGQVNLLFARARRARDRLDAEGTRRGPPALLLALAVVVKPYAVIFAPWLATRRRRGALVAMAAGLVAAAAAPGGAIRVGRQPAPARRLVADGHDDDRAEPD